MPNLAIAVKSHFGGLELGAHEQIRKTWGRGLYGQARLRFFIGSAGVPNSYKPESDEIILDCADDYDSLVSKTSGITKWFIKQSEQHLLLVDIDCVVYPNQLWASGFQNYDYFGRFNGGFGNIRDRVLPSPNGQVKIPNCHSWASGGGYFLSKKAANIVAQTTPIESEYIKGSYEDFWVGQILGPKVASGELAAAPITVKAVEYYLVNGESKNYDPRSKWMELKFQQYLNKK